LEAFGGRLGDLWLRSVRLSPDADVASAFAFGFGRTRAQRPYPARWTSRRSVATALHLGVTEFLTFDGNQKRLAEAEGLVVPL